MLSLSWTMMEARPLSEESFSGRGGVGGWEGTCGAGVTAGFGRFFTAACTVAGGGTSPKPTIPAQSQLGAHFSRSDSILYWKLLQEVRPWGPSVQEGQSATQSGCVS
eukprot:m.460436 g.460436  ORF g.460436 m.460436 type:complete len:107 (+) comp22032_c0_seq1:1795-2115(+)